MLALLADENFNGGIIRGVLLRRPAFDLLRLQDVGLIEADDPTVLEWAASHNRIVLTHDRATMPDFAYQRVVAGVAMPGLFVLSDRTSIREAIEELFFIDSCSEQSEWSALVVYLPSPNHYSLPSNSCSRSFVVLGFALPLVARMTCPIKKPKSLASPAR